MKEALTTSFIGPATTLQKLQWLAACTQWPITLVSVVAIASTRKGRSLADDYFAVAQAAATPEAQATLATHIIHGREVGEA